MPLPQHVEIPEEVMARQVGDETVLLDLASGSYFGLDAVGTRIWELLIQGVPPAEACGTLLKEYDVDADRIAADVERLLGELAGHGLIRAS